MATLTTSKKNTEPNSEFGLPEERNYPMPDVAHARNAKARASQAEHAGKLSAADKKKADSKADEVLHKKKSGLVAEDKAGHAVSPESSIHEGSGSGTLRCTIQGRS